MSRKKLGDLLKNTNGKRPLTDIAELCALKEQEALSQEIFKLCRDLLSDQENAQIMKDSTKPKKRSKKGRADDNPKQ